MLIEIGPSVAAVYGAPAETVREILSAEWHEAAPGSGPLIIGRYIDQFATTADNGDVITRRGLVPRLAAGLRARGYVVEIVERAVWLTLLEAQQRLEALGTDATPLQRQLSAHPIGQIVAGSTKQAAAAIAQGVALYGDRTNVLVLAKNIDALRKLRDQLEPLTSRQVVELDARWVPGMGSILLTTPISGVGGGAYLYGLAFYVGVEVALNKQVLQTFDGPCGHGTTRYALMPEQPNLTQHEQMRIEAVFGRQIYRPASNKKVPRVSWLPSPPLRGRGASTLDQQRNCLVARAAQAIAAEHYDDLPPLLTTRIGAAIDCTGRPARIAIFVCSREHAAVLQGHLPGWPMITNQTIALHRYLPECYIITEAATLDRPIPAAIVMRASGTMPQMRQRELTRPESQETELIVDLSDGANKDAMSRYSDYVDRGWRVDLLPRTFPWEPVYGKRLAGRRR